MRREDRVPEEEEILVGEGCPGPAGDKNLLEPRGRPQQDHVVGPRRIRIDPVSNLEDGGPRNFVADFVAVERFHVPRTVDVQVGTEHEEPKVRNEEGPAMDGQESDWPLTFDQMLREQGEPVWVALRFARGAEECGSVEGGYVGHEARNASIAMKGSLRQA